MTSKIFRRRLAAMLVFTTACLCLNLPALAADTAMLQGRVVAADGVTPVSEAIVTLVDVSGERTFSSSPTGEAGTFRLDSAPAGSYALVVDSRDGAYLAASEVALQAGENPPVALAIKAGDSGSGQIPPPPSPTAKVWKKWVFIGLVGMSAAATVKFVGDDEDKGSPF
jgi:hypothetical protein